MSEFLLHLLKTVWRERVEWFWQIWLTMTVVAAIGVAWFVGLASATLLPAQTAADVPLVRRRRYQWSFKDVSALIMLALLLVGYIVLTLKWENFANWDESYFTLFTLKGRNLPPTIWRGNGRFFPLGHQEFNLIRHFTSSVAGYHVLPLAQLLIVSIILIGLDDELSIAARASLTSFVLLLPGFVTSFTGLVFPERNLLFWFAWLALSVKRFEQTQSASWAVAAALCAQFMIYYKETAFLLLTCFAIARLVLRCRRAHREGWDFSRLRDRESRLDFCFISLSVLFLLFYTAVMLPQMRTQYLEQLSFTFPSILIYYLQVDWLVWLFLVVLLRRSYLIFRRRVTPWLFWDGLAFGGAVYFASYLVLRLANAYYLAPVDLIAVMYIGRLVIFSWEKMRLPGRAAALALALLVLLQGLTYSGFRVFERKNIIHAKEAIADLIVARYQTDPGGAPRLFFPYANIYSITELAPYLMYRGVSVESASAGPVTSGGVVIEIMDAGRDGKTAPCVPYRSFVCHARKSPAPGDLVIELPDDFESLADISPYRSGGELLLSYEPRPRIPQWMFPFVRYLRPASVFFYARKELPDRWLHASVIRWK